MNDIVSILQEQAMKQPTQSTPTEKSQIVIVWTTPQPPNIQRFSSVKKGQKAYDALRRAWDRWHSQSDKAPRMHDVDGDMFFSTVDLHNVAGISFVDHSKRDKFIPV